MASPYDPVIDNAAREWNVDPNLIRAVIGQESGGNPRAQSKAGAQGLMQIIPETQRYLGITDPHDPVQNIFGGAKYLSEALDREKTPEDALRYYHGGPDWRQAYGPESQAYAPAVTARYQQITAGDPAVAAAKSKAGPVGDDVDTVLGRLRADRGSPTPADPDEAAGMALAHGDTTGKAPTDPDEAAGAALVKRYAGPPEALKPAKDPNGVTTDQYGNTSLDDSQQAASAKAAENALNRIQTATLDGAKAGAGNPLAAPNPILSDKGQAALDDYQRQGGLTGRLAQLGSTVAGDVGTGINILKSAGGAVLGGYQGGVAQAGQEVGAPILGRDLAALPEAFPTGDLPGRPIPRPSIDTMVADEVRRRLGETQAYGAPAADLYARNRLVPPEAAPASSPAPSMLDPNYQAPQPGAPSGPRSAGAAASTAAETNMSPAQVQAYRSTAEGQKLLEPQPAGIADRTAYVRGVNPNAAEIEQSVNTARELKSLNVTAPAVSEESKTLAAANNDARQQHFAGIAGSPVDAMNARAARSAQAESDLAATFGNKKATDAQPVADTIQSILSDPRGSENTALQQYVKPLLDRLKNADGTLKSDPEQLYGLREDISRMQSKAAKAETPTLDHVSGQLDQIKTALDAAIEKGAPGYQRYLKNYADASRPIDTMETLQGHEAKLYDAQNRMTYNKVQTMMRQIVDSRAAPGINPYKSIPDETMQQLWNLRDDLRRSASAQELARTPGSDTAQNVWDAAKHLGRIGAEGAAHGVANVISPGFGSMGLAIGKNALSPLFAARAARKQTARGMQILHPDPSQLRPPD